MGRSSKILRQNEAILQALMTMEKGASIEEIKAALVIEIELRTLQRRLAELKVSGAIRVAGDKRSTRYYYLLPPAMRLVTDIERTPFSNEGTLPLSEDGQEIRSLVLLPEQLRKPVGYNREFLERYRPNIDSYLTPDDLTRLATIGKTLREDKPAGTYAREILNRLLIDLSWNSSRLEGNTYSLLETERLIREGKTAGNKSVTEAQMILNHKDAIEFLVQGDDEIAFNRYTITNLHALLSNELLSEPAASGRLRTFAVGITKSVYTPLIMPQMIESMFELLLNKASQIRNPFEQAFFVMVHIPYLQPFEDVNKRVSRLAANIPFSRQNLSPLSFIDVPRDVYTQGMLGIYELNRTGLLKDIFMWAYERSALRYAAIRQSLGEPDPFHLKYREQKRTLITAIISKGLDRETAITLINDRALQLPSNDQAKFIEVVDTELMSLHEGNFARYRVSPAEFRKWKEVWDD